MDIQRLEIFNIETAKLKPYSKNTKKHPEDQIDKICKSIKEFGFNVPIIVDKENTLIAGHGRVLAANKLGMLELPVIIKDNLSAAQIKAYRIADNKTAESDWEWDLLKEELADLEEEDFDLELTGFSEKELNAIMDDGEVSEDDYEPPEEVETDIKLGVVIELGKHRLMCGDSITQYSKFIKDISIDLLFTDPPYGVSVVGKNGKIGGDVKAKNGIYMDVIGDDKYFNPSFLLEIGKNQVIWGANYFHDNLPLNTVWLVWDKDRPSGTTFSDCELAWTNKKGVAIQKYKCTWNGMIREGESEKRLHPTQKPLKICNNIIKDFTKENESVLDLFGGSGSTLIASEQLNRICYMMELDEKYCEVICQRWEKLTGKKRVVLDGSKEEN